MKKIRKLMIVFFMAFFLFSCQNQDVTVHFETNGGNAIEDVKVKDIATYDLPLGERDGYTFEGWYTDSLMTVPYAIGNVIQLSDVTVYAKWSKILLSYTISFTTSGGSLISDMTLMEGSTITLPSNPFFQGYTFGGWFVDQEYTEPFELTIMPEADLILYAKWIPNEYTISFSTNGGSPVDSMIAAFGSSISEPEQPVKSGYTFAGWISNLNEPNTLYAFSAMPDHDITLYALWTVNSYTLSFESTGGSSVGSMTETYLTSITEPGAPTKEGYTFSGWYIDQTYQTAFVFDTMPSMDLTLYALWTPNIYNLIFYNDDGSVLTSMPYAYGSDLSGVTLPETTLTGYHFTGWNDSLPAVMPSMDLSFTPRFEINTYTLSFETNGGNSITALTFDFEETITLPSNPTKTGYVFGGWYVDMGLVTPLNYTIMPAMDLTLYAKWNPILYTITLTDFIDGNTEPSSLHLEVGSEINLPTPDPVAGYTFIGWYEDSGFVTPFTGTSMPTNDFTLYGRFDLNSYTVTYDTNGGTSFPSLVVVYKDQIPDPGLPVKTGFIFAGWFYDALLTFPYTFLDMPPNDLTVYAKWVEETSYYPIDLLSINEPTGSVIVQGVIYYLVTDLGEEGFYLYDGTGYIFVESDPTGLSIGDGLIVTATYDFSGNFPMLVSVTDVQTNGTFITMPNVSEMSLEYLSQMTTSNVEVYGEPVMITGVLEHDTEGYYFTVGSTTDRILIHLQTEWVATDPLSAHVGQNITIQAVIRFIDVPSSTWEVFYDPAMNLIVNN